MSRQTGQPIDPDDPWSMAQGNGYDVDNYYTRSTDGKGHSENVQAKLSPALLGEIYALIHSKQIPAYRTPQDFIRDACIHRAKHVSDLIRSGRITDLEFGKLVAAEAMLAQIGQARERRQLGQRLLDETSAEIKELLDAGKRSDAWDRIEEFEDTITLWSDDTVYRHMVNAIAQWRQQLTASMQQQSTTQLRRVQ